jgi:FAD-linked sulfhydryl oxidase
MQHNLQQLANNLPKPPGHQQHSQQHQPALSTQLGHGSSATISGSSSSTAVRQAPLHGQVGHRAAASLPAGASQRPKQQQQQQQQVNAAVTKEELGRSTWVFLHTLAAQFPEHPTRQQQRDARQLMDSFTRIYPCADCAKHFQEVVRWAA